MRNYVFLNVLATAFLAGEPDVEQIRYRIAHMLGQDWRWIRGLAQRYVRKFTGRTRPRKSEVAEFLMRDRGFQKVWTRHRQELLAGSWLEEPQRMQPALTAMPWRVPAIESAGGLAEWLALDASDLFWFADLKGLGYKADSGKLSHYHYRALSKGSGLRLIESPKAQLKQIQRQILTKILERVPGHNAAHGFVKRRSIQSFVAPHVRRRVVLRMDLQDFFPTISRPRVQALFRTLGYPEVVADLLGGLCTNAVPRKAWDRPPAEIERHRWYEAQSIYTRPHLPQGAPTSPALANQCFYRTDCRLAGLARSAGAQYTRYADDLAFSGEEDFERRVERLSIHVGAILLDEGWNVHHRKTRIMRQSVRQHLAGVVANDRLNVMRTDFDRLKAVLTNCVHSGPNIQNREDHPQFRSHLDGRVRFVETINPKKGQRLRRIFDRIQWE